MKLLGRLLRWMLMRVFGTDFAGGGPGGICQCGESRVVVNYECTICGGEW